MREVFNLNGKKIGVFNGYKIVDAEGNTIYWVLEGEVYSPLKYTEEKFELFNKAQWSLLGELVKDECIADGVVIFSIR